ncbi:MAG: LamG domain-containing protein [Chitinophagaceae bacterium]|nr:LamG domain-containing protein [Chitinophagaceae bacterium]
MKHFLGLLVLVMNSFSTLVAQSISPFYYWSFNNKETGREQIKGKVLDTRYYKCDFSEVEGIVGKAVNLNNTNCTVVTGAMKSNVKDEFSIEFFFKGNSLTFLSFSEQFLLIRFNYNGFLFRTTTLTSQGKSEAHNFQIALKGAGKQSYNYYTDNNWHHLVFTACLKTGEKKIYVDGECPEGFSTSIPKGKEFEFGTSDGFRNTDQIDELAFYNRSLPEALIQQHSAEVNNGKSYSFSISKKKATPIALRKAKEPESATVDPREYAPGYPDYTIQATDQLKTFPLPQYNASVPVKRNMSWMDISYLHRELPGKGGKGFGKINPAKAVELTEEMVKYWNYYIDLPTLRTTADAAQKNYMNTKNIYGALINYANQNPQYPVATILIEAQGKPAHAGFASSNAYVSSQNLSEKYYLKNEKGVPVIQNQRKWLSPLMPLDIIKKDGQTSRFYLNQLMKHLKKAPALINENGEVFGHIRKEALLKQDPRVWKDYTASGLTESQYSGRFQYLIDSTYRATIMQGLKPGETHFSFYNLSAFNPSYWPDYAMRRELNRWDSQTVYPTPDFYPRWPDNWQNAKGAYNGYGTVAAGRVTEVGLGDRFFSPFVSAGWGEEENNIRPAQWLALLKSMVMLGADFFYTGYFNVTGAGGKWPNGVGPYDPRGYAYQIAMPAYAQAVRTWAPEFFGKGELLNPANPNDKINQFRFKGKAENELILVRKLGKRYLIYGSIQPNSNIKGNIPLKKETSIDLEGQKVSFEIRKQGSMYILDLSGTDPVFYQLDGWHQYEHPWYWNKSIVQEAEMTSSHDGDIKIITERNERELNFNSFTTYCELTPTTELNYALWALPGEYVVEIIARLKAYSRPSILKCENDTNSTSITVDSDMWEKYNLVLPFDENKENRLRIINTEGVVQIDKLILKKIR